MPPKAPIHYRVKGRYQFPIDMLRYDCAWPSTEQDAAVISNLNTDRWRPPEDLLIAITSYREPTTARWESFGWKVDR